MKKVSVPANEKDLRVIAMTNHFPLIFKPFVLKWFLHFKEDLLDSDQFGGRKGHADTHNLIEVQNAILYNQDLEKPFAILMTAFDIEKGFNKIEHIEIITRISDMNCPAWFLKIVSRYLKGRSLTVCWQSNQFRKLPLNLGRGKTHY